MKSPLSHIRCLEIEEWLENSENVERVTYANWPSLIRRLAKESDIDSYTVSPAYYAYTGRRGLWIYSCGGTYIPLCWHPNLDGQMLIFPPLGHRSYDAIAELFHEAPMPPAGFLLARFKSQESCQLHSFLTNIDNINFEFVEESVLDWRYPIRILSTLKTAQMLGHEYMLIRNRIQQAKKYWVDIQRLSVDHVPAIEKLAINWASKQAKSSCEEDLVTPYRETLRLLKQGGLGLDGLVFVIDGNIQSATMWDVSSHEHKIANLYMNLSNVSYRGLSEFSIKASSVKLCEDGVSLLNLGGSETAGLDRYKNKFSPVLSVSLCSVNAVVMNAHAIDSRGIINRTAISA